MHTVQLYRGKNKQWYLRLVGANGETLAQSEGYTVKWSAKRAAKKNFPGVPLVVVEEGGQ
jgi:uncharacterized protein YegP (UPF0339 family)